MRENTNEKYFMNLSEMVFSVILRWGKKKKAFSFVLNNNIFIALIIIQSNFASIVLHHFMIDENAH